MGKKYFFETFLLHLPQRKDFYEPNRQNCMSLQKLKCSTIFSWENMHSLQKKLSQNFPVIFQFSDHIFIQFLYKHYNYNYANNRPLVMRFELYRVT